MASWVTFLVAMRDVLPTPTVLQEVEKFFVDAGLDKPSYAIRLTKADVLSTTRAPSTLATKAFESARVLALEAKTLAVKERKRLVGQQAQPVPSTGQPVRFKALGPEPSALAIANAVVAGQQSVDTLAKLEKALIDSLDLLSYQDAQIWQVLGAERVSASKAGRSAYTYVDSTSKEVLPLWLPQDRVGGELVVALEESGGSQTSQMIHQLINTLEQATQQPLFVGMMAPWVGAGTRNSAMAMASDQRSHSEAMSHPANMCQFAEEFKAEARPIGLRSRNDELIGRDLAKKAEKGRAGLKVKTYLAGGGKRVMAAAKQRILGVLSAARVGSKASLASTNSTSDFARALVKQEAAAASLAMKADGAELAVTSQQEELTRRHAAIDRDQDEYDFPKSTRKGKFGKGGKGGKNEPPKRYTKVRCLSEQNKTEKRDRSRSWGKDNECNWNKDGLQTVAADEMEAYRIEQAEAYLESSPDVAVDDAAQVGLVPYEDGLQFETQKTCERTDGFRAEAADDLIALAVELRPQQLEGAAKTPKVLRQLASQLHGLLRTDMAKRVGRTDLTLLDDWRFGFPDVGDTPDVHEECRPAKDKVQNTFEVSQLIEERREMNETLLENLKETDGDDDIRMESIKDANHGSLSPLQLLGGTDLDKVSLTRRLPVKEQKSSEWRTRVVGHKTESGVCPTSWSKQVLRCGPLHAIAFMITYLVKKKVTPVIWMRNVGRAFRRLPVKAQHLMFSWVVVRVRNLVITTWHMTLPCGTNAAVHGWHRTGSCCKIATVRLSKVTRARYVDNLCGSGKQGGTWMPSGRVDIGANVMGVPTGIINSADNGERRMVLGAQIQIYSEKRLSGLSVAQMKREADREEGGRRVRFNVDGQTQLCSLYCSRQSRTSIHQALPRAGRRPKEVCVDMAVECPLVVVQLFQ